MVDKILDVSLEISRSNFFTSVESFLSKKHLLVSVCGLANATNFNEKFWTLNARSDNKENFINIRLVESSVYDILNDNLRKNSHVFGYYASINDGIDGYGLLTPTVDENIWCIKLFNKQFLLSNIKDQMNVESSNVSAVVYPGLLDFKNQLLDFSDVSTDLVIEDSFGQISKVAAEHDDVSLDIGINLTSNTSFTSSDFISSSDKVLKIIDPIKFLCDRYFATLYEDSTLLEHFVKSSIPKMHLLRRDNLKLAKDCLFNLMVESLIDFDKRHSLIPRYDDKMKIAEFSEQWLSNDLLLDETESAYRLKVLESMDIGADVILSKVDRLNDFLDKLKVRDLKLQILLNLEMLKIIQSETNPKTSSKEEKVENHDKKNKRQSSVTRPRFTNSLVGKKKRLIPTLLGTVIPTGIQFDTDLRLEPEPKNAKELTVDGTKRLIGLLFDKLCVCDAIMGLDYKDLESSWGFLSNCIIPFYEKDHCKLLTKLAIKSRGPTFVLRRRSRKEKEERRKERAKERQKERSDNRSSTKLERKVTNIDLSSIKLKRSHSSFNSKLDLSKKTFDMTKSTKPFSSMNEFLFSENDLHSSVTELGLSFNKKPGNGDMLDNNTGGFMTSKKRKLHAPKQSKPEVKVHKLTPKSSSVTKLRKNMKSIEVFMPNQIIKATPKKSKTSIGTFSIMDESPILKPPADKSNIIMKSSPIERHESPVAMKTFNNQAMTQIEETPKIERVQIRPGVFEIGSSPLKDSISASRISIEATPQRNQIITSSSPVARVEHSNLKSGSASVVKSTKRKLNFGS